MKVSKNNDNNKFKKKTFIHKIWQNKTSRLDRKVTIDQDKLEHLVIESFITVSLVWMYLFKRFLPLLILLYYSFFYLLVFISLFYVFCLFFVWRFIAKAEWSSVKNSFRIKLFYCLILSISLIFHVKPHKNYFLSNNWFNYCVLYRVVP